MDITTKKVGHIGEEVACKYLINKGFSIKDRNYWRKWGEIDIVAEKGGRTHFVEVKTVSRENIRMVSREILEGYQPEENVHPKKLARMARVIQTYIIDKKVKEGEWQFDVLAVFLDLANKQAKCRLTDNIVL